MRTTRRGLDKARALRCVLAVTRGDQVALDQVLSEASTEPLALAALVLALSEYAAHLAFPTAREEVEAQLERAVILFVLHAEHEHEDEDG